MDKEYIKKQIVDFIDSTEEVLDFDTMFPMDDFKEIMDELGFEENDTFDTNGWQVDFWWEFKKEDKVFTLGGSWYYGSYTLTNNNLD
jgi:hypothetical protein